ncbi:hypothetical protein VOLCADRAFT_90600 [Volvox carteri f. nagariensis]|uniref:Uncharacterized protein n=1 Tax=Volvox carteri f. nagariensis TaxID=3068 RepID=D8TUU6_VOLCA|nr:uncharacterized protein VOLCADRAFT_90600 [Volvox carteri f. nagariensis]EFJ48884.1 hypothetical protein VOLCADRAFT_90600 [Volvox carteri f. nagariensis]|eukprot:XP_002950216.1 hypothetical protein VOLCADRAFT_90600 [Volvox carteri f. nagariensis]
MHFVIRTKRYVGSGADGQGPGRDGSGGGLGEGAQGSGNNSTGNTRPISSPAGSGGPAPGASSSSSSGGGGGGDSRGNENGTGNRTRARGDDPRPRSWGAANVRNETEFDDRKSPRKVAFLGKSANVRVYPNYSDTSAFLQLRFGKILELDGSGQPVPNHQIASLADASDAVTFAAGNRTIGNVNVSFVNVTLRPLARQEFRAACGGGGGGGGGAGGDNRPSAPPAPPADMEPRVAVELLFGLDDVLTVPYGGTNLTVPRNGLKWTISYSNWPFCNVTNTLSVSLDLLLPANATSEVSTTGGITNLVLRLGHDYNASLSFLDYALDGPNGATKLPANVTVSQLLPNLNRSDTAEGDGGSGGGGGGNVVTVRTVLPNPKASGGGAAAAVWYDPTSATTSVYLDSTDPGNGFVAVGTSGGSGTTGGGGGGAAAGLRVTVWAALAAVLLSAFLMH